MKRNNQIVNTLITMATYSVENLRMLEKCPSDIVDSFLHQVVDGMCGHCRPRYQDYGKVWSIDQWYDVVSTYENFIKSSAKRSLSSEEVKSELQDALPDNLQRNVAECAVVRQTEIRNMLLAETATISQCYVKDFDWKVKLAVSSDKISSVQEPLVAVELDLMQGEESKALSVEMDRGELQQFIQSLDAANKALLQLKS
ncbi:COMM domain-containing protein 8-like [Amphiura filiformis]|uniref:COMM domain-containing protein 8-like n=1 Tax=Amphiura filiformis TaxID=82378 RepID=UPI003B2203B5